MDGTCPYPNGPCTGPGTIGGPECDHSYLPDPANRKFIAWDYHDCGDDTCTATGAPLYVPEDASEAEREEMAETFHRLPCPAQLLGQLRVVR